MKKSFLIIIFSIFTASLFIPGGYGSWGDVLTIKGKIEVVEPPPPPPVVPTPTPTPTTVIPDYTGVDWSASPDNPGNRGGQTPERVELIGDLLAGDDTEKTKGRIDWTPERVELLGDISIGDDMGNSADKDEQTHKGTETGSDVIQEESDEGTDNTGSLDKAEQSQNDEKEAADEDQSGSKDTDSDAAEKESADNSGGDTSSDKAEQSQNDEKEADDGNQSNSKDTGSESTDDCDSVIAGE